MNIKKIFNLFIFVLILFGVTIRCFAFENSESFNIHISGSIFKTNREGQPLEGAKFRLSDFNNSFSYESDEEGQGLYGFSFYKEMILGRVETDVFYDTIIGMLPRKNRQDITRYLNDGSTDHFDLNYRVLPQNSGVEFYIPLYIEEISAPEGYVVGEKIVVPALVKCIYNGAPRIYISATLTGMYLRYNPNVDYANNFSKYLYDDLYENELVQSEDILVNRNALNRLGLDYMPLVLINERGNVSLKINNYVNNLESYTTSRGTTLNYKIEVVNDGNASSHQNVIVTKIPTNLEYVKGSASDGGIYNRSKHIITWNIDEIAGKGKISLRYSALVPKDVPVGSSFIGSSTITSQEVGMVQSRETKVSLITNPETVAPVAIVVLLVSMMGVLIVIKNHKKEKELDV